MKSPPDILIAFKFCQALVNKAMEWLLIAWLFVDGRWQVGDNFDGWSAMTKPSEAECIESMERANRINFDKRDLIKFTCEPNTVFFMVK